MGISKNIPLCLCGCGQAAARYNNPDGTFNCWRKYAAGHALALQKDVYAPTDVGGLNYAAAVIDCEGCIHASIRLLKNGCQQGTVRLVLTMCSPGVALWMQEKFGGKLTYGQPKSAIRQRVTWQLVGTKIEPVLLALLPYLKEKRPQAEVALQFVKTLGTVPARTRVPAELQVLRADYVRQLKELKTSYLLPEITQVLQ